MTDPQQAEWSRWLSLPAAAKLLNMTAAALRARILRRSRKLGRESFDEDDMRVKRIGPTWRIQLHMSWLS